MQKLLLFIPKSRKKDMEMLYFNFEKRSLVICIINNYYQLPFFLGMCRINTYPVPDTYPALFDVPGMHFYVMYLAPAEPCFLLTKCGFIRHYLLSCNGFSIAQRLRAPRQEGSAALVLGSFLVAASLVTCNQQSNSR